MNKVGHVFVFVPLMKGHRFQNHESHNISESHHFGYHAIATWQFGGYGMFVERIGNSTA